MTKLLFAVFVLALAALNWAALHDILKGEPNVWQEWTVVLLSVSLVVGWLVSALQKRARKDVP